jgi:hypothetical protein
MVWSKKLKLVVQENPDTDGLVKKSPLVLTDLWGFFAVQD